jgi:hypothetical protein
MSPTIHLNILLMDCMRSLHMTFCLLSNMGQTKINLQQEEGHELLYLPLFGRKNATDANL